jgi:ribosomal peptide maturation radical SAM protein 1
MESADVALVTMPYASLSRPPLGLGILKAMLAESGISAVVLNANLWFAEATSLRQYELCATYLVNELLTGEWTFAAAAFPGEDRSSDEEFLDLVCRADRSIWPKDDADGLKARLRALREAAEGFVTDAAVRVLATGARVVGCTSTFQQHVPSLALLRKIRELDPDVITMMGGANCESDMGMATHRNFPWVDYVVSGEAEGLIGPLCRLALDRGRVVPTADLPAGVIGPAHRRTLPLTVNGRRSEVARAMFRELDKVPVPDFDDYFRELRSSRLAPMIRPGLPLESSRGCWWGARHHCTFCGLNGSSMAYRSRPPELVLRDMQELEKSYGISRFEMVDNILDMGYLKTLLPALEQEKPRRSVFFEVKANLSRDQVAQLARAGVNWIQPGIESLHSEVLRLMDKGVAGWQNIQLLKWAQEYGIRLSWAILWGFPGESDEYYREMAQWIPRLEHLEAPTSTIKVRFDRFSVYFERSEQYGLTLRPNPSLRYVYPLPDRELADLTYFFTVLPPEQEEEFFTGRSAAWLEESRPGMMEVSDLVQQWWKSYRGGFPAVLSVADRDGTLTIIDSRRCAVEPRTRLTGLGRAVYLACDSAPRPDRVAQVVREQFGIDAAGDEIDAVLADLDRRQLVVHMDGRVLTLAVHHSTARPPGLIDFPGGHVDLRGNDAGSW